MLIGYMLTICVLPSFMNHSAYTLVNDDAVHFDRLSPVLSICLSITFCWQLDMICMPTGSA